MITTNIPKPGDRVRCLKMNDDPRPIIPGMEGTVKDVDDIGTIHVVWDDGRLLGLIPEVDFYEIVKRHV